MKFKINKLLLFARMEVAIIIVLSILIGTTLAFNFSNYIIKDYQDPVMWVACAFGCFGLGRFLSISNVVNKGIKAQVEEDSKLLELYKNKEDGRV